MVEKGLAIVIYTSVKPKKKKMGCLLQSFIVVNRFNRLPYKMAMMTNPTKNGVFHSPLTSI